MKNFDPINIKLDEKLCKNILIYYIGYVMMKDSKYLKIYSLNSLYLIFNKLNGYFEEINGNKYLMPVPTKFKFNSDDEIPLNKMIKIPTITIAVKVIFLENNKYPQVLLDEYLHEI